MTRTPKATNPAARLAAAAMVLTDIAQHLLSARDLLRDMADNDTAQAVAGLLSAAGWLADCGAALAGEPGNANDPAGWLMSPRTYAAFEAIREEEVEA